MRTLIKFLLLLAFAFTNVSSSVAQTSLNRCLEMRLMKDGKLIAGPREVTFLDQRQSISVTVQHDHFCVPAKMADEPALDMSFTLGKERFYFPRTPIQRFQTSWDISFGGRAYRRTAGLPKGTNPKQACTVVVHQGEPEMGMVMSGCRVPAIEKPTGK